MRDQPETRNQIFISYRREDTSGVVGRIYDRLVQRFGKKAIFKDVDSIPLGKDFRRHIDSVVSDCCVALIVVGDRWLTSGGTGTNRLDDPRDYVRIEIEAVLKRDIPVIPLLVQNALLPTDEKLPESIRDFTYRNGMSIGHDPHFHTDMDRLIKHLEEFIKERSHQEDQQSLIPSTPVSSNEQAEHTTNVQSLEDQQSFVASVSEPKPLRSETPEPPVLNAIQQAENKEALEVGPSEPSGLESSDDQAPLSPEPVQVIDSLKGAEALAKVGALDEAPSSAAQTAMNANPSPGPKNPIVLVLLVIGAIIGFIIFIVTLGSIAEATGIPPVFIGFGIAALVTILGAIGKRMR